MIVLIDNYDSFSYNLVQLLGSLDSDILVFRNDEKTCREIEELHPNRIVLSPGPGRPENAGICEEAARYFAGKIPLLGVCLGHQAICEAYGGRVSYARQLMHGKQSDIYLKKNEPLFRGLGRCIKGARYHSLAVEKDSLPPELQLIAETKDGEVMAVRHRDYPIYGLQFHPESILTPEGGTLLKNFMED